MLLIAAISLLVQVSTAQSFIKDQFESLLKESLRTHDIDDRDEARQVRHAEADEVSASWESAQNENEAASDTLFEESLQDMDSVAPDSPDSSEQLPSEDTSDKPTSSGDLKQSQTSYLRGPAQDTNLEEISGTSLTSNILTVIVILSVFIVLVALYYTLQSATRSTKVRGRELRTFNPAHLSTSGSYGVVRYLPSEL